MATLDDREPKGPSEVVADVKKSDKGKWLLVFIGFVTLVITYRMYKSHQTTATAAAPVGSAGIDPTTGLPYSGMPSNQSSMGSLDFAGLNTNLHDLIASEGSLLTALTATTSPPQGSTNGPTYTSVAGEALMGAGYSNPSGLAAGAPIITPSGIFSYLPSWNQIQAIWAGGGTVYAQTTPGNFTPWAVGQATPATPLYAQLPNVPNLAPTTGPIPSSQPLGGTVSNVRPFQMGVATKV